MPWEHDCNLAAAAGLDAGTAKRWHEIADAIELYAAIEDLDPALLTAVAFVESRFNPRAVSKANARGIMQLIPVTGADMAKRLKISPFDFFNPEHSIAAGAHYLGRLRNRWKGRPDDWAIASYYAGAGNVAKYGPGKYDGYVRKVRTAWDAVYQTRRRCQGSAEPAPKWQPGARPTTPKTTTRPSTSTRPAPAEAGGGGGGLLILAALALLGAARG